MLLVKCHALCDPNGLGYKLSNASASPEQCTIDCAASLVHGELFSSGGRQNRTQNASRLLRQTKDDASEHGKLSQATLSAARAATTRPAAPWTARSAGCTTDAPQASTTSPWPRCT